MSLRITYRDVPDEVREVVEPLVEDWQHLVPGWVRELSIFWTHGDDPSSPCACSTDPEYRFARIYLFGGFLGGTPDEREGWFVHELIHLPLAPAVNIVEDLLDRLLGEDGDPEFYGFAKEEWRKVFEGAVQDITYSLLDAP